MLGASQCQISGCTTKLWSSRQCGTVTNTDTQINGYRMENPEVGPQLYGQLIFDKAGKTIHWKNKVSSINAFGKFEHPHAEE